MLTSIIRLDDKSREFARSSARRLAWYGGWVALGWLAFSAHSMTNLADSLQFACTLGALIAVGRAFRSGVGIDADTLTYWDEGLLLNFIAVSMHLTKRFIA